MSLRRHRSRLPIRTAGGPFNALESRPAEPASVGCRTPSRWTAPDRGERPDGAQPSQRVLRPHRHHRHAPSCSLDGRESRENRSAGTGREGAPQCTRLLPSESGTIPSAAAWHIEHKRARGAGQDQIRSGPSRCQRDRVVGRGCLRCPDRRVGSPPTGARPHRPPGSATGGSGFSRGLGSSPGPSVHCRLHLVNCSGIRPVCVRFRWVSPVGTRIDRTESQSNISSGA